MIDRLKRMGLRQRVSTSIRIVSVILCLILLAFVLR
ncbi:MAG: hypothetical protein ACI80I_001768 [Akkermansiaceae bacterium]|jgi:hypothetical protein